MTSARVGLRGRRRGSALILVLLMTLAVAALAVAAIFMSSSAGLLSRFYDRERQFSYAAESALEQAISKLQLDTSFAVTSTTPVSVIPLTDLYDASGAAIAGAKVQVWGAITGDTTSSGPITVTLLAQVSDVVGTRFVRRVDLRREHFAQINLLVNNATTAATAPFETGASIVGRIHVNGDWAQINPAPTYRDSVSSVGIVGGNSNAFLTAKVEGARRIPWPSTEAVLVADSVQAAGNGLVVVPDASDPTRIEFVWVDDGDGVPERAEGFVRVFDLDHASDARLDVQPTPLGANDNTRYFGWDDPIIQNQCGAFYRRGGTWQFFPVATHRAAWAQAILAGAGTPAAPSPSDWQGNANDQRDATIAVLQRPTARCFPAGSPYLVNTERFTDNGGTIGVGANDRYPFGSRNASHRYGGQDTTFTARARTCTIVPDGLSCQGGTITDLGRWRELPSGSGTYLKALDADGVGRVLYSTADVRASGTIVGRVKLTVRGRLALLDRLVHGNGPNADEASCEHLFGAVSSGQLHVVTNPMTRLARVGSNNGSAQFVQLGGSPHLNLHGAYLSLGSTFGADGNGTHFGAAGSQTTCDGSRYSGGCLRHAGSAAMMTARSFSTSNGAGFRYTPTADACFERGYRPPFWPATNRYTVLRALDVRTRLVIGNGAIAAYYATLQGT